MNTRGFRLETNFWSLWPTLCGLGWLLGLGLFLGLQAACGTAFDLPGTSPEDYCELNLENTSCKSLVEVYVNRLDSVESVLPYEYDTFDFCQDAAMKRPSENIGQALFGEQIISSPYKLSFNKTETCVSVCVKTYNAINKEQKKHLNFLRNGIRLNYQHHWIIDSMPVTWCRDTKDGRKHCTRGFPIGCFITRSGKANDDCINRIFAMAWESSRRWPKSLGPYTHVGDLREAPGSWLRISSALAIVVIWGVNQWMEDLFLSLALPSSVTLSFK